MKIIKTVNPPESNLYDSQPKISIIRSLEDTMRAFRTVVIAILLFLVPANQAFAHTIPDGSTCANSGFAAFDGPTWRAVIDATLIFLGNPARHYEGICLLAGDPNRPAMQVSASFGTTVVKCGAFGFCEQGFDDLCHPYTFSGGTFIDCEGNEWTGGDFNNPDNKPIELADASTNPCPDCAEKMFGKSTIQTEGQILGETIPVTGTPVTLVYNSDRTPEYKNSAWLNIPLTKAVVPNPLRKIDLTVSVLGKKFEYFYDTDLATTQIPDITPNLIHKFIWDGQDGYGRDVSGSVQAHVKIVFHNDTKYATTSSFGYASSPDATSLTDPATSAPINSREMKQVVQEYRTSIRRVDARALGIGGWTLDINHIYDPNERILHTGSGNRLSSQDLNPVITTLEGSVTNPQYMTIDSAGNLYFVESGQHLIKKRDINGTITNWAGTGTAGYNGDDIPANTARLNNPKGMAIGPNDELYLVDAGNFRVRKVDTNGIITTVAGNGSQGDLNFVDPATESPLWTVRDVAVDSQGVLYILANFSYHPYLVLRVDGDNLIRPHFGWQMQGLIVDPHSIVLDTDDTLYISDAGIGKFRVHKVTADRAYSILAGNGTNNNGSNAVDGVPATQSPLWPRALAIHNGDLYIADNNDRVRRVTSDGIISTVAGPGDGSGQFKDNVFAVNSIMNPTALAVDASGKLIIADGSNNRVRQVKSPLPGADSASIEIPAEAGLVINMFDNTGRHIQTKNAMTGAPIFDFGYDAVGRIISVTDGDGDVTTIQRDGDGKPLSITSQDGQVTLLDLNTDGYLASVTNPNGEVTTMDYTAGGLLTGFQKPRFQGTNPPIQSIMEYDADGLLIKDTDPAGGFVQLARASLGLDNTQVDVSTAEGRISGAGVTNLSGDDQNQRVSTDENGLQTFTSLGTDGSVTITEPDGTTMVASQIPDKRFGMLAPLPGLTLTTPINNLVTTINRKRDPALQLFDGAGNLTQQVDELTINGRLFKSEFNKVDPATNPGNLPFRSIGTTPMLRTYTLFSDVQGRIGHLQVPGIYDTNVRYDGRGRLEKIVKGPTPFDVDPAFNPNNRISSIVYNVDGFIDHITDPENRTVSFLYNNVGRVTKQILPDLREINITYDSNGNVASITPPGRPLHGFDYTNVDLENEYAPPNVTPPLIEPRTFFSYNLDRQVTSITRPDGKVITMGYDTGGRVSTVTLPDDPPGTPRVYSSSYNSTTGNLETLTAPDGGTLTFTYDGSLLLSSTWGGPAGSITGSVTRTYDSDSRITSHSINGGNVITFGYDLDSLLISAGAETLTYDPEDPVNPGTFLPNGLLRTTTLGVVTDSYSYNSFGEISNYAAQMNSVDQFATSFVRDKLARITQKTETVQGVTHSFDYLYNQAGYLVEVKRDNVVTATYTYDLNGNRLNNGAVYDDQDRLTSTNSATYTYTDNGELLTKTEGIDTTQYKYDVLGNLLSVTLPSGTLIEYVIDGQNRRVGKKVDGVLQKAWLYKDDLNPIAELDGSGNVTARFVYASKANVLDYMIKGGVTYRIISDHLGSPRLVINTSDGTVVQVIEYDEWGIVLSDTNPGFTPFSFAAGLYDVDTKLIRFGARDYDPETGRWTGKDPIRFSGGDTNLFGYVLNNPVNFVDPTGLAPPDQNKKTGITQEQCDEFHSKCITAAGLAPVPVVMACELYCIGTIAGAPVCVLVCNVGGGLTTAYLWAQCDKALEHCKKNICENPVEQLLSKSEKIERNLDRGIINTDELGLRPGQIQGDNVLNP